MFSLEQIGRSVLSYGQWLKLDRYCSCWKGFHTLYCVVCRLSNYPTVWLGITIYGQMLRKGHKYFYCNGKSWGVHFYWYPPCAYTVRIAYFNARRWNGPSQCLIQNSVRTIYLIDMGHLTHYIKIQGALLYLVALLTGVCKSQYINKDSLWPIFKVEGKK